MRIVVTAGPTREAIDPVRFISNRSSGKMGYALADAAVQRGHEVKLISGPVQLAPPTGAHIVSVTTAAEMLEAVHAHVPWCDVLIMAAAVADYRPRIVSPVKLKKSHTPLLLELEPAPDILASLRPLKGSRVFVGFAAETGNPEREGRRKLREKGLDLVVANDVSRSDAGFEADTNQVLLLATDGSARELPLMSKRDVAAEILNWIEAHSGRTKTGQ